MSNTFDPVQALAAADAATKGSLDPQTVVGAVKGSASYREAIQNVSAIAGYGNTTKLYDKMSSLPPYTQAAAWQALSSPEQNQLLAVGYHAPDLKALNQTGTGGQHGGFWGALASGFHTFTSALGHAAHDVLGVMGAPLRAIQHVERDWIYNSEEEMAKRYGWTYAIKHAQSTGLATIFNPAAWGDVLNPGAWEHGWNQTMTGTTTLNPAIARTLDSKYGRSQVNLALRVLKTGETKIVAGTPAKDRQAIVQQLQDSSFKELMTKAANGRMSVGRFLVGTKFLNDHPLAGKLISGGIDASFDFVTTPLNLATGAITDALDARYLIGDGSRMAELINKPAVNRWIEYVGKYLERGDYGALGKINPRLDSIASQLSADGVDSADSLRKWLQTNAKLQAFLSGKAAVPTLADAAMPHLSQWGWLKSDVKLAMQNSLNRLADGKVKTLDKILLDKGVDVATHTQRVQTLEDMMRAGDLPREGRQYLPGVANPARIVRRLSTLVPKKPYIDISSDADAATVRRFFQGFLSGKHTDDLMNVYLHSDLGTRYRIVQAAREQMLHAVGLLRTPQGADDAKRLLGALDDAERQQSYSVLGLDEMRAENGRVMHDAVLDSDLATRIAIPHPQQVRQALQQTKILSVLHLNPMVPADRFMNLWKTLVLERPGFAVRFSLTENLIRLLRTGPVKFIGSYLANGAARTMTNDQIEQAATKMLAEKGLPASERDAVVASIRAKAIKPLLPYHPVERALSMLSERIPEGLRPYVDTPAKFYGAIAGATTRKWARAMETHALKALGLQDYITAATHLYTHQAVREAFADTVGSMRGAPGWIWEPGGVLRAVRDTAGAAVARWRETAHYSEARSLGDPLWKMKWQFSLDQVAHSQLGRAVLESIGKTQRTQQRAVLHILEDPAFAETKGAFARASRLPDGRVVGVDATQREADLAFANVVVKHVNALLRAGDPKNGSILHDLAKEMLDNGRGPAEESLDAAIENRQIPQAVYGPDLLQIHDEKTLFSKPWEILVGKPANWMARQPHFIHAYAEALPKARAWAARVSDNPDQIEKLASDLATEKAINTMIPFIHNPELRTQFENTHRILFPFLFAQRQFLQRWGRLMMESPDAFRKIQLSTNGLRTLGFIRKDANGTTYFYYPASEYPQQLITSVLSKLGLNISVPMVVPFTGQIKYLMPGLANPVMPSVGPFAAVGIKELAKLMPEFNHLSSTVLQQGATSPVWQQFTPSIVNRAWEAVSPTERGSMLASMTMQAIKYLDYAGYTLPNNATPHQIEQYVSRVQNWARSLLAVRAMLGFGLPATPHATLDPVHLDQRWHQLLGELPYTQAIGEFIREHPTATAYTVGETQIQTSGFTPATKATMDWLNAHLTFAKQHPLAAAWFVPRSGAGFTPASFREQIALGIRTLRPVNTNSPSDPGFIQEVIMSRAATIYYNTEDKYFKAYTSTTSSHEHQQLAHWWETWKAAFFKINPIFHEYITSSAGHLRRQNTIADVRAALTTPHLPTSPLVPEMRSVVDAYEQFVSAYTAQVGMYSSALTHERKRLKAAMVAWGSAYAQKHPQVATFWNTVIRYEVESQK